MKNEYVMISPVYLAKMLIGEDYDLVLADNNLFYKRLPRLVSDYMKNHKREFPSPNLPLRKMNALLYEDIADIAEYDLIDDIPLIIGILGRTCARVYDPESEWREVNLMGAKTLVFRKDDFYS